MLLSHPVAKFIFLLLLLLPGLFGSAQALTFVQAKQELKKIYQAAPEQKSFYCGCDIAY